MTPSTANATARQCWAKCGPRCSPPAVVAAPRGTAASSRCASAPGSSETNGVPRENPSLALRERGIRATLSRRSRFDHRGGLAEQDLFRLLAHRRADLRVDLLGPGIGAHRCRPRLDRLEPALQMRKILQPLALPLVGDGPGIGRDVGDRILAGDEFMVGKALVQDAVESVGLLDVAIDRVGDLLGRVAAEMMVLP